jgi:hypothetical protein
VEVAALERRDVLRDLELVDEPPVEPAVLPASEDARERRHRRAGGRVAGRAVPREVEPRELDGVLQHEPVLALQRRRGDGLERRLRPARDRPVPLLDPRSRLLQVEVAGDDEARVVRRVVRLEKVDDVLVARRREVFHRPDRGPVVGVAGRVERLPEDRVGHPVRPVLVALAPLVLDHVALAVDALGRHGVEERGHPVGVEVEREFEAVGRGVGRVVRPVARGRAVGAAAGFFEPRVDGALRDVARALEHEVLEQVGEARPPRLLAPAPNVVPRVDGDDRNGGVAVEDHVEPVVEPEPLVVDRDRGRLCEGRDRDEEEGEKQSAHRRREGRGEEGGAGRLDAEPVGRRRQASTASGRKVRRGAGVRQ